MIPVRRAAGAAVLARVAVLLVAAYLALLAVVLPDGERALAGAQVLDARPLFASVAALGVLYAALSHRDGLRWAWVVGLTLAALGRALTLILVGAPHLSTPRALVYAMSWAARLRPGLPGGAGRRAGQARDR